MTTKLFDYIIMLRFDKTKVVEKEFYGTKKTIKVWNVGVDNIVISKLFEAKNNSKYFFGYLDEVKRLVVKIISQVGLRLET